MKKKITDIRDSKLAIGAASIAALILLGLSIGSNFRKPNPNPIETKDPEASHTIYDPDNKESNLPDWISDNPTNTIYESLDPDAVDSGIVESAEPSATITDPVAIPSKIPNHWWDIPTLGPIILPSAEPSVVPSAKPSVAPSAKPSTSVAPTAKPSVAPSTKPSVRPSEKPIDPPHNQGGSTECSHWLHGNEFNDKGELYCWLCHKWVEIPGLKPSPSPSPSPSVKPTPSPSPSPSPSVRPTPRPSAEPTPEPSYEPVVTPPVRPTPRPTPAPTAEPSSAPSVAPTAQPSSVPSVAPTAEPSSVPSSAPSIAPTAEPSSEPSVAPSVAPTAEPSSEPIVTPPVRPTPRPIPTAAPEPSSEPAATPVPRPTPRPMPTDTDTTNNDLSSVSLVKKYSRASIVPKKLNIYDKKVLETIEKSRKQMADLLATLETEKQLRRNYTRLRRL